MARDNNAVVNLNIINNSGDDVFAPIYVINRNNANASQMIAKKYQEELGDNPTEFFVDKTLKLVPSNKNLIQGLIKEFFDKPRTLTYHNEELRQRIMIIKKIIHLQFSYIVNGEIIKDENKIIAYRILEIKDIIID